MKIDKCVKISIEILLCQEETLTFSILKTSKLIKLLETQIKSLQKDMKDKAEAKARIIKNKPKPRQNSYPEEQKQNYTNPQPIPTNNNNLYTWTRVSNNSKTHLETRALRSTTTLAISVDPVYNSIIHQTQPTVISSIVSTPMFTVSTIPEIQTWNNTISHSESEMPSSVSNSPTPEIIK